MIEQLTTTPLPPLPEVGYLGDDASYGYDANDMTEYATKARADLEAQLKQWGNVFGHLGTADECGNEWIKLQDENQRLREALEEIISYEHDWETLVEDLRHIAHEALEKQP